MLQSLYIENIAVIERADIAFDAGLNILTGETGAGKSIVIDAINAVLGERVSRDIVRTGSSEARVTALFSDLSPAAADALREWDIEPDEDGCLLIQRTISAGGKGTCRIGGRPVTVSILRDVGRRLVNIHGQHENQALLSPERHVTYLDRLGGHAPLLEAYREAYDRLCSLRRELDEADMDETMKARRIDLLRYQIEEIEAAELTAGEEEELEASRRFYRHAEAVAEGLAAAKEALSGDEDTLAPSLVSRGPRRRYREPGGIWRRRRACPNGWRPHCTNWRTARTSCGISCPASNSTRPNWTGSKPGWTSSAAW